MYKLYIKGYEINYDGKNLVAYDKLLDAKYVKFKFKDVIKVLKDNGIKNPPKWRSEEIQASGLMFEMGIKDFHNIVNERFQTPKSLEENVNSGYMETPEYINGSDYDFYYKTFTGKQMILKIRNGKLSFHSTSSTSIKDDFWSELNRLNVLTTESCHKNKNTFLRVFQGNDKEAELKKFSNGRNIYKTYQVFRIRSLIVKVCNHEVLVINGPFRRYKTEGLDLNLKGLRIRREGFEVVNFSGDTLRLLKMLELAVDLKSEKLLLETVLDFAKP